MMSYVNESQMAYSKPIPERSLRTTSVILIVDDDHNGREILAALLRPYHYELLFASDGYQALAMAQVYTPDVILLDVMMPGMDGYEVCQQLRSIPITAEMPVVLITALDDRDSRLQGLRSGADDFISKPVDAMELQVRVRTITRLNRYRLLVDERRRAEQIALQAAAELTHAYDRTLEGWVRALALRDVETEAHSQRVTDLTLQLAERIGYPQERMTQLWRGALLHDIGKIGIPDSILLKPGKLTQAEMDVIRKHPEYAYNLLHPIEYLHPVLNIPYAHHERWDGSGYPQGLRGDAIPLEARMFALVDVWDALGSDRPYRKAMPTEYVERELQDHAGILYDPELVPIFLQMMHQRNPTS